MSNKITLQFKPENIHPKNILENLKSPFISKYITEAQIVLSTKYLQEFINCSIAKKEGKNDNEVIYAHVDDKYLYQTTLTAVGTDEKNTYYVVNKVVCKQGKKIVNSYRMNNNNEVKVLVCFVKSPERGKEISTKMTRQEKANKKNGR